MPTQQDSVLMYNTDPNLNAVSDSNPNDDQQQQQLQQLQQPETHAFNGQDPHNPHPNANGQANPEMPSELPSSYTTQENGNGEEVVYIVIGIVAGLAVIAAVGIFFACRKRKNHKKETMANAYLEFSQSQASTGFGRNKSQNPTKTNEESYYY